MAPLSNSDGPVKFEKALGVVPFELFPFEYPVLKSFAVLC
jgi:hypothetical protein